MPKQWLSLIHIFPYMDRILSRVRRKALHFNNNYSMDSNKEESTECYGLKSSYSHTQAKGLTPFQNDFVELIRNIKFRKIRNTSQEKLEEDIKLIKESNKTMTPADRLQTCID